MLLGSGLSVFAQPKASFDKTMHEFGTILWKNPVTATFKITNKGDKPLVKLLQDRRPGKLYDDFWYAFSCKEWIGIIYMRCHL